MPVRHVNSSATVERQQKEVLAKFEGMARGLKVSLAYDTLTDDFRRRLTVSLMAIADSMKVLLAALNNSVIEERVKAENMEPDSEAKGRKGKKNGPVAHVADIPMHINYEALQKAQIIKEDIAQHHGEKSGKAATRTRPTGHLGAI